MLSRIGVTVLALSLAVGAFSHFNRVESSASKQSTDDAYIEADFTVVSPQISGVVAQVLVEDNQSVSAGDMLAVLDDRDAVIAVKAAVARVTAAQAEIASLQARLVLQDSLIRQSQAALVADEAALVLAHANAKRYRNLAADGSGSLQAMQQADAELSISMASKNRDEAGLEAAQQQIKLVNAELDRARAVWATAQAAQEAAELQLSYTRIAAPISGTIGARSVRKGMFVNVGKPLLAIIPLEDIYIAANFRETQLARIQVGQSVEIAVDAFPGATLTGRVESLGPASGVSYSAIAPHNATGNFTKIVQRLPVRIRIDAEQPLVSYLRVGMSVQPSIDVSHTASEQVASVSRSSVSPVSRAVH
jgi:membrane fusion protein (multidrug efflux system)